MTHNQTHLLFKTRDVKNKESILVQLTLIHAIRYTKLIKASGFSNPECIYSELYSKLNHTVILPDLTLEKWVLPSFAFKSF